MSGHNHRHGPAGGSGSSARWRTAFLLTIVILAVELVAGVLSHSLALLSDAGHVLTDFVALGLAWFASVQAGRPADARRTFGYHRTGILAALANAATLIVIVLLIAYEAFHRFQHPEPVTPGLMFVAAAIGIALNLFIVLGLRQEDENNLNVRAAMLHIVGDVAASVGVIVGGIIILLTGWYAVDPIVSLLIAVLIARGAWDILRETLDILMEATPRHLDMTRMVTDMSHVSGVEDVHDLHVWSVAGGMSVLSAHVQLEGNPPLSEGDDIIGRLNGMLRARYSILHTTIQLECAGCDHAHLYCEMQTAASSAGGHHHDQSGDGLDVARVGTDSG